MPLIFKFFHQLPLLTLVANLGALPLMHALIMPLIVMSLPFWIFDWDPFHAWITTSLEVLVRWAQWIQSISPDTPFTMPPPPPLLFAATLISGVSLIFISRPRGKYTLPFLGCTFLFFWSPKPDVFLSHLRPYLGVHHQNTLYLPFGSLGKPVPLWEKRLGSPQLSCLVPYEASSVLIQDSDALLVKRNDQKILFINEPTTLPPREMGPFSLIIGRHPLNHKAPHVLTLNELRYLGATEIYWKKNKPLIRSSGLLLGNRSWNPYREKMTSLQKKLEKLD